MQRPPERLKERRSGDHCCARPDKAATPHSCSTTVYRTLDVDRFFAERGTSDMLRNPAAVAVACSCIEYSSRGSAADREQSSGSRPMTNRAFISFEAEDKPQNDGLSLLAKSRNYELESHHESVRTAIDNVNALYSRTWTCQKIDRSGVVLCLVNDDQHTSNWVPWELETTIALGRPIAATAIKRPQQATLPAPIRNRVSPYPWDPASLNTYLADAKVIPRV